ncbi:unnamed protein product [Kuraishia capsulata CBS 1993]|uniref:DUF4536 domain-containing protein n=1 Tax=Kuraishia capsulata CBS 1993 TaxID=1382522 RepID=W6MKS2_9ASCO|nr:uncharacterized protein KUCA_T00003061001 [Kuraishia capsulata CBS 1993]CDK27084.1 unnamed protein product [Kuraishia capsulata CBS 1993]
MSNLAKIFNPPESRDLSEEEVKDCIPCQVMASFAGVVGGAYFASGMAFKGANPELNPLWWKNSIRIGGVGLIAMGIYRGGQGLFWPRR